MVFEKPVVDKAELLRALDPIHGHGEETFRRLRAASVLSPGVAADSSTATAADETLVFCEPVVGQFDPEGVPPRSALGSEALQKTIYMLCEIVDLHGADALSCAGGDREPCRGDRMAGRLAAARRHDARPLKLIQDSKG